MHRYYQQQKPNVKFMKQQTQKISLKASKAPTPDKNFFKTSNQDHRQKNKDKRRSSEYSGGQDFIVFLNDYIHQLKQNSSGRSSSSSSTSKKESELQRVIRDIEEQKVINRKLSQRIQDIQNVLLQRDKELSKLGRKVEKMVQKQNSRKDINVDMNMNLRVKKDNKEGKYKISDFMKRTKYSQDEDDVQNRIQTKNYTENDLRPRRKSTVVQKGQYSKPMMREEIENLISQTVGLKTSNKYMI